MRWCPIPSSIQFSCKFSLVMLSHFAWQHNLFSVLQLKSVEHLQSSIYMYKVSTVLVGYATITGVLLNVVDISIESGHLCCCPRGWVPLSMTSSALSLRCQPTLWPASGMMSSSSFIFTRGGDLYICQTNTLCLRRSCMNHAYSDLTVFAVLVMELYDFRHWIESIHICPSSFDRLYPARKTRGREYGACCRQRLKGKPHEDWVSPLRSRRRACWSLIVQDLTRSVTGVWSPNKLLLLVSIFQNLLALACCSEISVCFC